MAGVSAADVRGILAQEVSTSGTTTPGAGPSSTPTPAALQVGTKRKQTKPDGISRELFALIGQSVPTLTAQLSKPKLKPKPRALTGGGKVGKWEWRTFTNSARSDSLNLGHWVKATSNPQADYPFAKYNVPQQSYTYSGEEYTDLLQDDNWSKEETDYLFSIVQEYDQRFFVISDRYAFPEGPTRSIEDLKDRYYAICRKLIRSRPWPGDEASKTQALTNTSYDKERELNRKKYIESLESRTQEEILEEEALFIELKRLEQNERNFAREREELLRILEGVDSGLAGVASQSIADEEEYALMLGEGKVAINKKRKGGMDVDSPLSAGLGLAVSASAPPVKKTRTLKEIAQDATNCIHRFDNAPAPGASSTKAAHQPAFLRSYKIPTVRAAVQPRVAQVLSELSLRTDRLVMPTLENVQQLELLLNAATALVETRKAVERVEQDVRVYKERVAMKEGRSAAEASDGKREDVEPDADADADADASGDDDAEGEDDADGDGETDRAASVAASSRKGGQKRSVSVSSMGSNTTTATRAQGRKRQRS